MFRLFLQYFGYSFFSNSRVLNKNIIIELQIKNRNKQGGTTKNFNKIHFDFKIHFNFNSLKIISWLTFMTRKLSIKNFPKSWTRPFAKWWNFTIKIKIFYSDLLHWSSDRFMKKFCIVSETLIWISFSRVYGIKYFKFLYV